MPPMQGVFTCFLLVSFAGSVNCSVFSWGGCPAIDVENNFDMDSFLGKWFEIARFPNYFENGATCVMANYTKQDDGSIDVVTYTYGLKGNSKVSETVTQDQDEPAKLYFKSRWWLPASKVIVIDTDYDHYALLHSCSTYGFFSLQKNWIVARQDVLSITLLDNLLYRFEEVGIDVTRFEYTVQGDCPDNINKE